ncbi:MAG: Rne/Rng family ribonuclease [Desulfuromonadales bacterium]|nr:Rne/Rng family ribonuclease [Desulfuromonadales bacterium]
MSKKMLVNATQPEENRVAIVEDGILTELDIEVVGREQTRGNIYKATVVRVESGLQAAFVDYGGLRLGFLQMGEIHPDLFKATDPNEERKGRLRINDVLRRGQEILVQVVKGERGNKGAALTTFLSLAGRYMVLMPESDSTGVSRKIEEDSVRKKLKATMNSLDLPKNMGYIVRTAGVDQTKEELKRDFDYLVRVYENILALAKKAKAPALIYKESNLVIRSIRDYFTPDIDEVLVDDPKVAQEAKDFLQQVMPECVKLVKLHQEKRPIFSRYQIEEQIEIISRNKVLLPSGGSIVIDRTEALVAIDVNSGKMAGEHGVEATAYKTNLEAATEIGRQLRLRDLGGLVVIDFIDMRERKNNRDVEKAIKESMKSDKAKVSFGKISSFGLLEMSRQRIKDALAEGTFLVCPHCEGSGRLKSPEAQAVAALRKIQGGIAKGHIARIEVDIPLDAANYLLNAMRDELFELEQRNQLEIMVRGRADMIASQIEIACIRCEKEDELYLQPVTASNDEEQAPRPVEVVVEKTVVEAPTEKRKRGGRGKKSIPETLTGAPTADQVEVHHQATTAEILAPLLPSTPSPEDLRLFGSLLDESDDEADDETPVGEGDGTKKKRKRRRKKKPAVNGEAIVGGAAVTTETKTAETDREKSGDIDETEVEGDEEIAAVAEGGDEAIAAKKKKRRRKRKKKPSAAVEASGAEENPTDEVPVTEEAESIETAESVEATGTEVAKKKRKRRRKKKGSSAETPSAEESAVSTLATELIASLQAEVVAEPPTPKAPRKGRQPKAAGETAAPVVAEVPPAQIAEEAPAKPKRPRRKPVAEVPAEIPTSAPIAEEVPAPAKRTRAKKAVTVADEPAPASLTEEVTTPRKRGGRKPKEKAGE